MKIQPSQSPFAFCNKVPFKTADPHNFGRYVFQLNDNYIFKPRCIFWEWLFLGASPLRGLLDNQVDNLFSCLPKLHFETNTSYRDGAVELFTCNDDLKLNSNDFLQMGAILALFSFFGITDLHRDNTILGRKNGKFICGALDIESFFDKVELPAQTLLIPSKLIEPFRCGYNQILTSSQDEPAVEQFLYIGDGYYRGLNFLSEKFEDINDILTSLIKQYNPIIRRVLKSTKQYAAIRKESSPNTVLDLSESNQLIRGDIPYFFKFPTTKDVYFYADKNLENLTSIEKSAFDQTTIENLTLQEFTETIKMRSQKLITNGLLQVLRLIPPTCSPQSIKINNLLLILGSNDILVETASGLRYRCKRLV